MQAWSELSCERDALEFAANSNLRVRRRFLNSSGAEVKLEKSREIPSFIVSQRQRPERHDGIIIIFHRLLIRKNPILFKENTKVCPPPFKT